MNANIVRAIIHRQAESRQAMYI